MFCCGNHTFDDAIDVFKGIVYLGGDIEIPQNELQQKQEFIGHLKRDMFHLFHRFHRFRR